MPSPIHDFSGFYPLIRIGNDFALPTYFIIVSLALCICALWLVRRAEAAGQLRNTALDIGLAVMFAGFVGARLFHVLFEEPAYYLAGPMRIFEIWRGGFVWYGGAIAGAAAGAGLIRRRRLSLGLWLDLFAPVIALGYALGRVACVLTGCCYGDVCVLASGYSFRHPTQIYAVVWESGALALLLTLERRSRRSPQSSQSPWWSRWPAREGGLFAAWLILHSVGRIMMEAFRADPRGAEPLGLSLSTWISLVSLFGIAAWWRTTNRTMKR